MKKYGTCKGAKLEPLLEKVRGNLSLEEQAILINVLLLNDKLQEHIKIDFISSHSYNGIFNWFAKIRHYCFKCGKETRTLESWITHLIKEHDFKLELLDKK